MSASGKFDPAKYLKKIQVGGRNSTATADYLEVKHRVMWVRSEHPDAHMETRVERLDGDLVVMGAMVSLSNGAQATGHGSCRTSEPDAVEKAETAALGRALAVLGYGTQFALYEERGVVDAPAGQERESGRGGEGVNRRNGPALPSRGEVAGRTAAAGQMVGEVPAEPAADLMPADPRAMPVWFRARVAAMPELSGSEETIESVARSVAVTLREAGMPDEVRKSLYMALTGQESGVLMEPRELALLAQLTERVEVLKEVGLAHMANLRPGLRALPVAARPNGRRER